MPSPASAAGLDLPEPFPPAGLYVNAVRTGDLLVLGGHIPIGPGELVLGRLGDDLDVGAGRHAAALAARSALATIVAELGSLDRVARVVSVRAVLNATPDFTFHTQVADGASQVLLDAFGEERGRHARLAVGVGSLPAGLALELELLVEVRPG